MSKKVMKISSIFKSKEAWQWPSCNHPKTLSFRATNDVVFKTLNSIFLDTSDSSFTNSSSDGTSTAFSTDDDTTTTPETAVETIIRDVRSSERIFFEPGHTSSLILNKDKTKTDEKVTEPVPFEESVALALESDDPYSDFKKSMQEMVETHGLEEWDRLEELLGWYLKMNARHNHGFIVGAFVDVLLGIVKDSAICRTDSTSYSSADSCFSAPSSPLFSTPQPRPEEGDLTVVLS